MNKKSQEQIDKEFEEECEKAGSNVEMPFRGSIETPICMICKHFERYLGTLKDCECLVNSSEYHDCHLCRKYMCKDFEWNPDSTSNYCFDENHQPING